MSKLLWLVGAGTMAQAYAKVLRAQAMHFEVVGRGNTSAAAFLEATGIQPVAGGVEAALAARGAPEAAIIATAVQDLASVTLALVRAGTRRILVEKPGGLALAELAHVQEEAETRGAQVWLAYNRRFYESVRQAQAAIAEDGGVTSVHFEFTEWAHVVGPTQQGPGVKERWALANSTHVIDLVFLLCGSPADWRSWRTGGLEWHPAAARFCGAGVTRSGVLFSYLADWEGPGRWGVELITRRRRLILRPIEQLQCMQLGSVKVEPIVIDDRLDREFKPGLYRQTEAFLEGDTRQLCTLERQVANMPVYAEIAGYTDRMDK